MRSCAAVAPEPAPMRDWGLVDPSELERIVVVSPHLDDAVLGCAQLLAAHAGSVVVTVFAGRPPAYPDPMTHWDTVAGFTAGEEVLDVRRDEDAAALAELDASPVWLDHVEHQYLGRADWVRADAVVDSLERALRAAAPTLVLAPFGLANPDHGVTHDAAMLVRDRFPEPAWLCYEDSGYKHIPGLLAWRVSGLFRAGVWPTPVAVLVDADQGRKRAAIAHYRSQLLALEADWRIGDKLAAPAPEQYWRLAPPPPGWERLAEGA